MSCIGTNASERFTVSIFRTESFHIIEDGSSGLLRNVGTCMPKYTDTHYKRPYFHRCGNVKYHAIVPLHVTHNHALFTCYETAVREKPCCYNAE